MRRASSSAAARARCASSGRIGTIGTTSAAPIRGCTPSCARRSIRSRAHAIPASSASTSSRSLADEREHRAVVVGVGVDVEQLARARASARADRLDDRGVAAFREVRHGLERQRHRPYSRTQWRPSACRVRLKPGSLPRVRAWAAELNARRDEVLATLRDEGVIVESVFLDGEELVYYLKAKDVAQAQAVYAALAARDRRVPPAVQGRDLRRADARSSCSSTSRTSRPRARAAQSSHTLRRHEPEPHAEVERPAADAEAERRLERREDGEHADERERRDVLADGEPEERRRHGEDGADRLREALRRPGRVAVRDVEPRRDDPRRERGRAG